jgi:hypothetical protein
MENLESEFLLAARHFLYWTKHLDRLWTPTSLLPKTHRVGFLRTKQSGLKATTYTHLVPTLRMCGAIPPLSHVVNILLFN